MRFSLQSFTLCVLSTQAGFAFAGPCKPRTTSLGATTTTALAEASTTTTVSEESATTLVQDTTVTVGADSTATTLADLSTTVTLGDVSTTTTFAEESTATTVAETTTTIFAEESTTTTAGETTTTTFVEESTTTTLAETTTTTAMTIEGTPLAASLDNGEEAYAYLRSDGYFTRNEDQSTPAIFAIEPETSRLFVTVSGGSKLYCMTAIPNAAIYASSFITAEEIENSSYYNYVTCTEGADQFLSCQSEVGPTDITWYYDASNQIYYGTSIANFHIYPNVRFRIQ